MTVSVSPSVARIALWLDQKVSESRFSDIGVFGTIHRGRLTKVRFEQTIKEVNDDIDVLLNQRKA